MYYLTPDTRHKQVILNLYGVVENALRHIEENLIKEDTIELDQASLNNVTDTDKLWATICSTEGDLKNNAISILGEESFQKYKNLGQKIKILGSKKLKETNIRPTTQNIDTLYKKSISVLESISNISKGILSYTLKFEQNTANPNIGGAVVKNTREKYIDGEVSHIKTGLSEVLKENISSKPLSMIFPPDLISHLVTNIGGTIVKIAFQSKGYGVVNRHGITGQIRAFLLKEYISMFSIFIKNHYYHILSLRNETDQKNMRSDMIKVIDLFIKSYKEGIKVLPNKDNEGSLYFHLTMFANPDDGFKEDRKKMEKWNKSKLGKFYKD
ncbi:hypothetical protein [Francisella sp. SYW-9]|uniref:hypothetical protein n=1 Tax=Francisella sp. SYW-9 TaxID=2610888 RepID=UPI00123C8D00|nr:hypothetical protein [Francisella sp. SYW-9]